MLSTTRLKKHLRAVIEHYEEVKEKRFFQFMHDGATLLKDKHQAYGMIFTDKKFAITMESLCLLENMCHMSQIK